MKKNSRKWLKKQMNRKKRRHIIYSVITDDEIKMMVETLVNSVPSVPYFDFIGTLVHEFKHNEQGKKESFKFIALNIRENVFYRHSDGTIKLVVVKDKDMVERLGSGTWFGYSDESENTLAEKMERVLAEATYGTKAYASSPIQAVSSLANLSDDSLAHLEEELQSKATFSQALKLKRDNPVPERKFKSWCRAIESKNCDQAWIRAIKKDCKKAEMLNKEFKDLADVLNGKAEINTLNGRRRTFAEILIPLIN